MALPSDLCAIPEDVCCTSVYDVAYHFLTELYDAIKECYPPDPCGAEPLNAYVTHGFGDDGVRNALSVAILAVTLSPRSQDNTGRTIPLSLPRATYEIRLKESGWPMAHIEAGEIVVPDPVQQNALAKHSYAHGERIYRRMRGLVYNRQMTPSTEPRFSFSQLGPLTPLSPLGGVVGWTIRVDVDLVW